MRSTVFVNLIRFVVFVTSAIALASHAAQCVLYKEYQRQTGIPDWLTAGHWQYFILFASLTLSVLCGTAVCVHGCCCGRAHIVRGDRTLSIVNICTLLPTILLVTFLGGQEPWTNGHVEFSNPAKGFIPYCDLLDATHDILYPLLYHRCLLVNATWISACSSCFAWIVLLYLALFAKPRRPEAVVSLPMEPKWHQHYSPHPASPVLSNPSAHSYPIMFHHEQQTVPSVPVAYPHEINTAPSNNLMPSYRQPGLMPGTLPCGDRNNSSSCEPNYYHCCQADRPTSLHQQAADRYWNTHHDESHKIQHNYQYQDCVMDATTSSAIWPAAAHETPPPSAHTQHPSTFKPPTMVTTRHLQTPYDPQHLDHPQQI